VTAGTLPDPRTEIRLTALRSLRGANFWSRRPVVRLDVAVGAYDEISSAEVPGFTEALVAALPGLWEHRCSVGERGGFVARLRDGTYAPHIAEHVGLELQSMAGHDVGYGRARGGDRPGEYTVVMEHRHAAVGQRAAALALEVVRRAFAGTLSGVEAEVAELRALARTPDVPPLEARVLCGVTGGGDRAGVRAEMLRLGAPAEPPIVEVTPAFLLDAGLPYAASAVAVVLDGGVPGVPARYAEPEMAARLLGVMADGVRRDGVVVVPAGERGVREAVLGAGRALALFAPEGEIPEPDGEVRAAAGVREGRLVVRDAGGERCGGALREGVPAGVQLAAALAVRALAEAGEGG
jgi:hypothetical protein